MTTSKKNQKQLVSNSSYSYPIIFEPHFENAMITLKEQVENLSKSAAPKTETTTITKEEITKPFKKSILSNESKGWVIYFFRLVNQIETLKQFEIFKDDLRKAIIEQKKNGFRRMTKIKKKNESHLMENEQLGNIILYVGTSEIKNLEKRITDHICFKEKGSAGLGLSHWPFLNKIKVNAK